MFCFFKAVKVTLYNLINKDVEKKRTSKFVRSLKPALTEPCTFLSFMIGLSKKEEQNYFWAPAFCVHLDHVCFKFKWMPVSIHSSSVH